MFECLNVAVTFATVVRIARRELGAGWTAALQPQALVSEG